MQLKFLSDWRTSKIADERHQLFFGQRQLPESASSAEVRNLVDECNLKLNQDPKGNFQQVTLVLRDQMAWLSPAANQELIRYSHETELASHYFFSFHSFVRPGGAKLIPALEMVELFLQGPNQGGSGEAAVLLIESFEVCLESKCVDVLALVG